MEIEKLVPLVGFTIIFLIIAWPALKGLTYNIRVILRRRKLRKMTPGPLLGVVFPKDDKDK